MSNLTETASFDAAVYQLATSDPVQGGVGGVSNTQAQALANRTKYLKTHMDAAEAAIAAIQATLVAPATTLAAGDDSTGLATTAFVHRNSGGFVLVDCAGAGNITLSADQWGAAVIILTGARTADGNVIFPTRGDRWLVVNRTTGLFKMTCKTAAGTGVKVAQTRSKSIFCDGTNILDEETDLSTRARTITSATTMVPGDDVYCDFTGGPFAVTAILNPSEGDRFRVSGNFATSNLLINRNGQSIRDKDGIAQAANYVCDRNALSVVFSFMAGAWQPTIG